LKQARARQTHDALVRAAASEFDRFGYSDTSLARISKTAGVTQGALTFHFPTKAELAAAVHDHAVKATLQALRDTAQPPPGGVASLTDALVQMLAHDPSVRAAARLARERPDAQRNWYASWEPELHSRLVQHWALRETTVGGPSAQELAALANCMVIGAEVILRGVVPMHRVELEDAIELRRHFRQLWNRLLSPPQDAATASCCHGPQDAAGGPVCPA
jgi:AcrR family transcriptional regulator